MRDALHTAAALPDAGHEVVEVADVPRLAETLDACGRMLMTEFAGSWPVVRTLLGDGGHRYIEMSRAKARPVGLDEYLELTAVHLSIRRAWAEFLDRHPLLLGPVFTQRPVEPGSESRDEAGHERVGTAMHLCTATSFAGLPAVAVPTGSPTVCPRGCRSSAPPTPRTSAWTRRRPSKHTRACSPPSTRPAAAPSGHRTTTTERSGEWLSAMAETSGWPGPQPHAEVIRLRTVHGSS